MDTRLPNRRSRGFKLRQANHYQALVEIALHALLRMRAGHDPEAMHDLRVSLRTQRVLLALFPRSQKISRARKRLGRPAKLAAQARDLEVALGLAESFAAASGQGQKLVEALCAERTQCQDALLEKLHAADLENVLERAESAWLAAVLNKPRRVLQKRARRRVRKLGKALLFTSQKLDQTPTLEQWRQVRLACKRLRYWVEDYSELMTHRQRRRLQLLRALLQSLMALHDLELFEQNVLDGKVMPVRWKKLLAERQALALHHASSALAELRVNW